VAFVARKPNCDTGSGGETEGRRLRERGERKVVGPADAASDASFK
jgi:hypothetical protein